MAKLPVSAPDNGSSSDGYASGLLGEVFVGRTLRNLDDALTLMRGDAVASFVSDGIDYRATGGSLNDLLGEDAATLTDPRGHLVTDQFALRLSGQVYLEAGTHRFYNTTDDGFRLTVGGTIVSEYGESRSSGTSQDAIEIARSGWYSINVDYFEAWGTSELRIRHSLNGGTIGYLDETDLRYAVDGGATPVDPVDPPAPIENTAPDARNDSRVLVEDGQVTLNPLANDIDADGDTMTITSVGEAEHGTVRQNANGTLTYIPNANFNGQDSFTYRISDGNGGTDTARVNLTVTAVNDAPVAVNDGGYSVRSGEVLSISLAALLANDRDVDGGTLSLVSLTNVRNGTATIVGDQVRFVASGQGEGGFSYTLSDGQGGTDTAAVAIAVAPALPGGGTVNTAPDARNDSRVLVEDGQVTLNPLANDVDADGDTMTITSVGEAEHGTVRQNANGTLTYIPNANFNGQDSFTYRISDGNGGTDTARVNLTVTAVNDAPVAVNDGGYEVEAGQMLMIDIADLLANDRDIDGGALSIVGLANAQNGTATIVGDQVRFMASGEGDGGFSYTVSDGRGGTDTATVAIDVAAAATPGGGGSDGGHTGGGGHGDGGHGGSGGLIDPPQTPAEIAAFVQMVRNMPEHDMDGHPAGMQMHMAALDLVSRGDATHIAINHGDWNDASTWHNGRVPGEGARVLIPEGIAVDYSAVNNASIETVRVDGMLHFATDEDSRLVVDTLVVSPSGHLLIGSADHPVEAGTNVDIVFADNGNIDVGWDPSLLSRGMIAMGRVDIAGVEKDSHLKVQVDAMAGDTRLVLEEAPDGWQVGDKLVLTGTYQQGFYWNNDTRQMDFAESQDEEVFITAINGSTITLNRPLTYDHDTPRDDLKAYVANMSRNVTFSSEGGDDLPNHQRGHVMFMHNDDVDVRHAGFVDLGRTDKSEYAGPASEFGGVGNLSADDNVEARYPFHFHEAGVSDLENPAIAIGNVVDGSPGWGFVHHSSNANLTSNVAFDVWGAAFVAEDGNETGTWYRNIAIKSQGWAAGDVAVKHSEVDGNDARTGDGFWFAGRLVEVAENVAANTTHGFVWLHRGDRDGVDPDNMHQSEIGYGRDMLGNDKAPIQGFRDNEAFGTNTGLIVVKENPDQGHDIRSVFDGFTNWETREGVAVSYTGHYTYLDFDLVGQRPEDGPVWDYAYQGVNLGGNAFDMVFNDIRIDGFNHAFNLTDNDDVNTGRAGEFHNAVIDGVFTNISGAVIQQDQAGQLRVLRGSDLVDGRLNFRLTADQNISDSDHLFFDGIKTDSMGSVERSYVLEQQGLWGWDKENYLNTNGYWRLPDGTAVLLIEDFIADRATGELAKTMLVFELDYADRTLESRYPYNGVIALGGPAANARNDSATTTANTDVHIDLVANDSDPDGGRVVVDGLTDPMHGNVYLQDDGTVLYRPNQGFVGVDHFYYWAADEEGNFTRAEAVVTVQANGDLLSSAMHSDMFAF